MASQMFRQKRSLEVRSRKHGLASTNSALPTNRRQLRASLPLWALWFLEIQSLLPALWVPPQLSRLKMRKSCRHGLRLAWLYSARRVNLVLLLVMALNTRSHDMRIRSGKISESYQRATLNIYWKADGYLAWLLVRHGETNLATNGQGADVCNPVMSKERDRWELGDEGTGLSIGAVKRMTTSPESHRGDQGAWCRNK